MTKISKLLEDRLVEMYKYIVVVKNNKTGKILKSEELGNSYNEVVAQAIRGASLDWDVDEKDISFVKVDRL